MEQNNLLQLAEMSFEGKNYSDAYSKYSQIVENDINNLEGWIGKGLSAGYLSNAEKNTLTEVSTILNHISKQTLTESQNNKIANHLISICREYIKILLNHTKDVLSGKQNKPMATLELHAVRSISNIADRFEVNNTICDNVIASIGLAQKASAYINSIDIKKDQINLIDKFLSEVNNEIHKDHKTKLLSIRTEIADEIKREDPTFVTAAPQKSDGCYIATHIYGDYDNESVITLRNFRDNVLRKTILGTYIVKMYYEISPKLVSTLKNKKLLNNIIRTYFLNPFVNFLKH